MRKLLVVISILYTLTTFGQSVENSVIRASDYGLKPNTYENSTPILNHIIQICKEQNINTLLLDSGRYDFWPEGAIKKELFISNTSNEEECPSKIKTLAILLEELNNFSIDGQGSTLMFHGKMTNLAMIHCNNITLQNITIDAERPCGSEMTIEKVTDTSIDVRFHHQSKYNIQNSRLSLIGEGWRTNHPICVEYNPTTNHFSHSDLWYKMADSSAEELSQGLIRFHLTKPIKAYVGNILTVRDHIRDEVGLLNLENVDVTFRNVNLRYMHAIGLVSQFSRNITMENVCCEPEEGSGRVLASSADFFHFSGCSGKVRVLNCRFSGAHDDPINVHGTNLRAIQPEGKNKLKVRFMHHQTYGMKAFWEGDTIAFVHANTMQRFAEAVVQKAERISDREIILTINRKIPENLEWNLDVVENITRTPEVEIRNCYFTHTSTRGTLVTTPRKVVIANNTYDHTGMSAILIAADAMDWYESGPVCDVVIENNHFIGCAYNGGHHDAVIAIEPSNRIISKKIPVHQNIRIINNTFDTWGNCVIYAKSTKGLTIKGNTINGTPDTEAIQLEGCSNVIR